MTELLISSKFTLSLDNRKVRNQMHPTKALYKPGYVYVRGELIDGGTLPFPINKSVRAICFILQRIAGVKVWNGLR